MRLTNIELNNIGSFQKTALPIASAESNHTNITILVGNNGAGKTTLLRAIAIALSWFVTRLRSEKGNGSPIQEEEISNNTSSAYIKIDINHENRDYRWTIAKTKAGRKQETASDFSQLAEIIEYYKKQLTRDNQSNIPLIAFYSVERGVIDIPLKIKGKHHFEQLNGYDNSLQKIVDFSRFFEWFREREDFENELKVYAQNSMQKSMDKYNDIQLNAVRTAISTFMPELSNIKVKRKPKLYMSVDKNGKTLNVSQLSQGEKSLFALVGDIARRLAIMNPSLEDPLQGTGVVLIDEVDMHLHPRWQRGIIDKLTKTFPNCQFILTTHSPLVISDSKDILVYLLNDGDITPISSQYGQDANMVLLEVMDTDIRNADINRQLNDLLDDIQDNKLTEAHQRLAQLEQALPNNHLEMAKAKLLLRKQELRHAKN